MTERYERMFAHLRARQEGAFVPFTVLGDPDLTRSLEVLRALVTAGADALELGIAFSDPVADGPVIQRADRRALQAGARTVAALELVRAVRREHSDVPIGLLIYASLVEAPGLDAFYARAADAGVDSVLIADVPTLEAEPFVRAATVHGVAPVFIAADNTPHQHLATVARLGRAYTYVLTRTGVTGADTEAKTDHRALLATLADLGAPPPLLGFGIATPAHACAALAHGAAGVISGSAVVGRLETAIGAAGGSGSLDLSRLSSFVREMKAATLPGAHA